MAPFPPVENWVPVRDLPAAFGDRITPWKAKTLFIERDINGLAEAGGAKLVGRRGFVNVPVAYRLLFGEAAQ